MQISDSKKPVIVETPAFGSGKDKGFFKDPFSSEAYDSVGSAEQAFHIAFAEERRVPDRKELKTDSKMSMVTSTKKAV